MSHINAYGDVAHGVAGGNASVNNVVFSPGAVGGWLDDNRVFFANGSAGWALYIYDRITKTIVPAITDTSDPQYGQGGNSLFARDGVWAAWLGGSDSHRGLYSNTGMRLPDGGLMGVGVAALRVRAQRRVVGLVLVGRLRLHHASVQLAYRIPDRAGRCR
jgi:hypothetical protein